jgi:hypothetical protein
LFFASLIYREKMQTHVSWKIIQTTIVEPGKSQYMGKGMVLHVELLNYSGRAV